jgi:hypothetical protein
MSPWRRPLAQGSQDRALTTLAPCATGDGPLKFPRDPTQFTQALLDVRKVMPRQLIDVAAG